MQSRYLGDMVTLHGLHDRGQFFFKEIYGKDVITYGISARAISVIVITVRIIKVMHRAVVLTIMDTVRTLPYFPVLQRSPLSG